MTADGYPLHHQREVEIAVEPERLFDWLDDPRRLASHMEKPSLMTAGSSMRFETDAGWAHPDVRACAGHPSGTR